MQKPHHTKILLIEPPYNRLKGYFGRQFSLSLGYIGAMVEKEGYDVRIYCCDNNMPDETGLFKDCLKEGRWQNDMIRHERFVELFQDIHNFDYVWDEVKRIIKEYSPDVVGITSSTANFLSGLFVAEIAKNMNENTYVVFGGPHSTALPGEVLSERNVDFVVRGEGEFTFLELINALCSNKEYEKIEGLSFKNHKNQIIHNPQREVTKEIDCLPFPARHLLINNIDNSFDWGRNEYSALFSQVVISRGCPFQCKFCAANTVWGRKWRNRSVESVIHEIKMLRETYGIKYLQLISDTMGANEKWMIHFCEALKPLNLNWSCITRIGALSKNTFQLMKNSGCVQVQLGIESGNDKILKAMKKGITVAQVIKEAKLLNKVGIRWRTFFMIGFPEESHREIKHTFRLIKKLKPLDHKLAVLVPYPGTEYYNFFKEEGRLPQEIYWNTFEGRSSYLAITRKIPEKEFIRLRNKMFAYVDRYNKRKNQKNRLQSIIKRSINLIVTHPFLFLRKSTRFLLTRSIAN